jgi:hypothetical protein
MNAIDRKEENMEKEQVKQEILKSLAVIRIYCATAEASGYSDQTLNAIKAEFGPILKQLKLVQEKVETL